MWPHICKFLIFIHFPQFFCWTQRLFYVPVRPKVLEQSQCFHPSGSHFPKHLKETTMNKSLQRNFNVRHCSGSSRADIFKRNNDVYSGNTALKKAENFSLIAHAKWEPNSVLSETRNHSLILLVGDNWL